MVETETHEPESLEAVAERLIFLRERVTQNQREWCRTHGIQATTWNNYEKAISRIRIEEAKKLYRAYGASLDWIYMGLEGLMPAYLLDEWRGRRKDGAA